MSGLKILRIKKIYQEKINAKKQGTQTNFQIIQNFENFCMEKHGKNERNLSNSMPISMMV
jgi:hypothetical protein